MEVEVVVDQQQTTAAQMLVVAFPDTARQLTQLALDFRRVQVAYRATVQLHRQTRLLPVAEAVAHHRQALVVPEEPQEVMPQELALPLVEMPLQVPTAEQELQEPQIQAQAVVVVEAVQEPLEPVEPVVQAVRVL